MVRTVWAVAATIVLVAGAGCTSKKPENAGVQAQRNPDPRAPGMMKPPGEGGPGLPKYIERKR
ncbi:MAG TPA: hypothetical protein VKD90_15665 [Gemmataceae bacterium]|nr:hypothetical protein [Gemmataceae bacterium]